MKRRLAAIVAADVVGYSRLIGRDEEGTLERLKAHRRDLVDPKIAEHHGRIVKTTGDGLLVEFPSAVEAVRCAVGLQRGLAERNNAVPQEQRIEFHVGDIIIERAPCACIGSQRRRSRGQDPFPLPCRSRQSRR